MRHLPCTDIIIIFILRGALTDLITPLLLHAVVSTRQ